METYIKNKQRIKTKQCAPRVGARQRETGRKTGFFDAYPYLWYNNSMIKFTIITLFREAIEPYLRSSMMYKATEKGLAEFDFVNLRDFGLGPHKSVDDTPYGGGDGMLLRCKPVFAAIESVKEKDPSAKVILPTPAGEVWTQAKARAAAEGRLEILPPRAGTARAQNRARELQRAQFTHTEQTRAESEELTESSTGQSQAQTRLSSEDSARRAAKREQTEPVAAHYIILCPHYEGYDERIVSLVDYKVSLGHYVLTGGELPALIIIDSIVRLIPGVLGGEQSAEIESFSDGDNIEFPQYTRPEDFRGMKVPEVLLSGNHGEIAKWRAEHSGKVSA